MTARDRGIDPDLYNMTTHAIGHDRAFSDLKHIASGAARDGSPDARELDQAVDAVIEQRYARRGHAR
jgi:hypothetical protein